MAIYKSPYEDQNADVLFFPATNHLLHHLRFNLYKMYRERRNCAEYLNIYSAEIAK